MTEKLAIHGGRPVRTTPMPKRAAMGIAERRAVYECLAFYNEYIADPGYRGEYQKRYTDAFCAYMGGGYADAVSSGTAALYIAIAALRLPKGSHVLVSPISDPGTYSSIILNGLIPKIVDSAEGSYNIDAKQVHDRMTKNVSAVLVVHAAGQAAPVFKILNYARDCKIKIIEDCSQAHGATDYDQKVGTFGDIACFSTMYRKAHMTGGSGGVVWTKDFHHMQEILANADRGKPRWLDDFDDRDPRGYLFPALNFNTSEIACAIGCASLARLDKTIAARRKFCDSVKRALWTLGHDTAVAVFNKEDSPFFLPVTVNGHNATEFAKAVRAEGIDLNPHYNYLASEWPWLRPYLADDFEPVNAKAMLDSSFNLYLNENYGQQEVDDTVVAILKVERLFHG